MESTTTANGSSTQKASLRSSVAAANETDSSLVSLGLSIIKTPIKKVFTPFINSASSPFSKKSALATPKTEPNRLNENQMHLCASAKKTSNASILTALTQNNLLLEYSALRLKCPDHCYVMPELNDITQWHIALFVHEGPFLGALFRFKLSFARNDVMRGSRGYEVQLILPSAAVTIHPCIESSCRVSTDFFSPGTSQKTCVSAVEILEALCKLFLPEGLMQICQAEANNFKFPNLDALKLLKTDKASFGKLAADCAKTSTSSSALNAAIPGCPFHFGTHENDATQ